MSWRLEGIVLRKKILRDSDLLLNVFSKTDGRLWLVREKALKKPQAELDLFCRVEFIISQPQDFALIYQAAGLDFFANIRRHYVLLQEASQAVKTVEKITSALQPNPGLYLLLQAYLKALEQSPLAPSALDNIRLRWYAAVLRNEGLYDGKPVTENSFRLAITNYRG